MRLSRSERTLCSISVFYLFLVLACANSANRNDGLPHGNRVEHKYGSKILVQPLADRDEVNYYQSELKFSPELRVAGKTFKGHAFDLGSNTSCKLSRQPPDKVVVTLIHEIPDPKMWQLPTPPESGGLTEPNAIVDLILVADGEPFKTERGYQSKLQKDLPTDATFYDFLIVEIPFQVFSKVANAQTG